MEKAIKFDLDCIKFLVFVMRTGVPLRRLRGFYRDERTLYVVHIRAFSRRILGMALIWRSRHYSPGFCLIRDFRDVDTLSSRRETGHS